MTRAITRSTTIGQVGPAPISLLPSPPRARPFALRPRSSRLFPPSSGISRRQQRPEAERGERGAGVRFPEAEAARRRRKQIRRPRGKLARGPGPNLSRAPTRTVCVSALAWARAGSEPGCAGSEHAPVRTPRRSACTACAGRHVVQGTRGHASRLVRHHSLAASGASPALSGMSSREGESRTVNSCRGLGGA